MKRFCTARKTRSLTAAMEWISSARYAQMNSRAAAGMGNTVRSDAPTMRQSRNENGLWKRGVNGRIIAKCVVNGLSRISKTRYGGIARRLVNRERIGRGNGHKRPVYRFDSPGRLQMPCNHIGGTGATRALFRRCEERRLNQTAQKGISSIIPQSIY